jgi:tetratricopeptide (TPR) repeat protein
MPTLHDRHGLPISTSSARAAEQYVLGLDRQLSLNAGSVEALTAAVEADPSFALGCAALAFARWYRSDIPASKISMAQARELAPHALPREQRHIEIVGLFLDGEAARVLPLVKEHLAEFPRDSLLIHLGSMTITGSGRLGRRDEAFGLLASLAPAWGDDWWFQGVYAFAHHEMDLLDESRRLAEASLAQAPRNASASHPLAHVFYESNDHLGGAGFLADWIPEYDRAAPFYCHLSWHLALFELARGNTERVLELYETAISPAMAHARTTLVDAASLLWRYELYGCQPRVQLPWGEVCDYVGTAAPTPGMAFLDAHAALAFAAQGDGVTMARLISGLEALAPTRPVVAEVVLPLARGIQAFGEGGYDAAVRWIEPLDGQLVRVGGSHAQWEVFEDTLLQAYLRTGRFEAAERLLRRRLGQRSSARDIVWLEQATASQQGQATASQRTGQ